MLLKDTQSLCPVCLKRIDAHYIERDGRVYLEKSCDEHGFFSVAAAPDAAVFNAWQTDTNNIPPKTVLTKSLNGCPFDCGTCAAHQQTACCVLLDITERCNQKCPYCFASANSDPSSDPPLAEVAAWLDHLKQLSEEERPFNIQLSGGEPTVRDDLPQIIALAKAKGFEYIQLNTNGKRLANEEGYAQTLADAGLSSVFLQFDGTLDSINIVLRGDRLLDVKKRAIANCAEARLPVALVPTVVAGVNLQNIGALIDYALDNLHVIKGIHFQPVSFFGRYPANKVEQKRVTLFDIMREIEKQTHGAIRQRDLHPLSTGQELCCFYSNFIREDDGTVRSLVHDQSQVSCCPTPGKVITRDRNFVKNKWQLADDTLSSGEGAGLDAFVQDIRRRSFTLTGMQFQDAMNVDLQRLQKCRVHVYTKHKTLVPFCAYNLTDLDGNPLYRDK